MRFWDASAIVPLLITEVSTRCLQALAARDPDMLVWWGSEVECALVSESESEWLYYIVNTLRKGQANLLMRSCTEAM